MGGRENGDGPMRGPWGRGAGLGAGVLGDWKEQKKKEKTREQRKILGNVLCKKGEEKSGADRAGRGEEGDKMVGGEKRWKLEKRRGQQLKVKKKQEKCE